MNVASGAPCRAHSVRAWLWIVCALIALMVLVGGATRLTGSGLSISEWQFVRGTVPPLSDAAWNDAFTLYQRFPEFEQLNSHFTLAEFKSIYWWEWSHRLLGRLLALAVAVPGFLFWRAGALAPWLRRRIVTLLSLITFQGVLGWLMVTSGLNDVPQVSHFRLAAHLLTALVTLVVALWSALEAGAAGRTRPRLPGALAVFAVGLLIQLAWGAFVAGLDAGLCHPTWPRMSGAWIPPDTFANGIARAVSSEPVGVQFVHRTLGAVLVFSGLFAVWRALRGASSLRASIPRRRAALAFTVALCGQFGLGVVTILNFVTHPVLTGMAHQMGAVALLTATTVLAFECSRGAVQADAEPGR